jgi:hypothetical protein
VSGFLRVLWYIPNGELSVRDVSCSYDWLIRFLSFFVASTSRRKTLFPPLPSLNYSDSVLLIDHQPPGLILPSLATGFKGNLYLFHTRNHNQRQEQKSSCNRSERNRSRGTAHFEEETVSKVSNRGKSYSSLVGTIEIDPYHHPHPVHNAHLVWSLCNGSRSIGHPHIPQSNTKKTSTSVPFMHLDLDHLFPQHFLTQPHPSSSSWSSSSFHHRL